MAETVFVNSDWGMTNVPVKCQIYGKNPEALKWFPPSESFGLLFAGAYSVIARLLKAYNVDKARFPGCEGCPLSLLCKPRLCHIGGENEPPCVGSDTFSNWGLNPHLFPLFPHNLKKF